MNEKIKDNIKKELPELKLIKDVELRNKVVEAWSRSLNDYGFTSISELQGSGGIGLLVLKKGTQVDHLRSVARISYAFAKEFQSIYPGIQINLDTLLAGALLHDVGKPLNYNKENRDRWKKFPYLEGNPPARHSVHGYHICLSVGLPMEIAHIVGAHSKEGEFIQRSVEGTIVHYADQEYWDILTVCGYVKDGTY